VATAAGFPVEREIVGRLLEKGKKKKLSCVLRKINVIREINVIRTARRIPMSIVDSDELRMTARACSVATCIFKPRVSDEFDGC